ncbi:hypothetical protein KSC_000780 [Ktedonobacter sp. SOSP1-52]|nr:hypothetical protein KSC_000780 [Ktedonobacter sp. SOSP1-52]
MLLGVSAPKPEFCTLRLGCADPKQSNQLLEMLSTICENLSRKADAIERGRESYIPPSVESFPPTECATKLKKPSR